MIVGIISLILKCIFYGFLSEKHSLQYVSNKGIYIYSVSKDLVKQT